MRIVQWIALALAMFAATAAGLYRNVTEAQRGMSSGIERVYRPDPERARRYDEQYPQYLRLGSFVERELSSKS